MSHILLCSPQGIGKTAKKCHKFVPTAWRHPPPSFFWKVRIGPLPIRSHIWPSPHRSSTHALLGTRPDLHQRSSSLTEGIQPKSMSRTVKGFVCEGGKEARNIKTWNFLIVLHILSEWALRCMLMNYPWTPTHYRAKYPLSQWVLRAKISKCTRTSKRWQMKNWRGERKGKQDSLTRK